MRKFTWLLVALPTTALLFAACNGDGKEQATPPVTAASPTNSPSPTFAAHELVSYQTEDGVRIVAEFLSPGDVASPPVVILLHQFGGDRGQWADLVPVLVDNGYAVLAPDLRSFGESTKAVRDGREENYELSDLNDMVKDVAAALDWLQARNGIDVTRIAVIGASVGANIAYVAAGAFPDVKTAVSMSPNASPQGGALLGRNVPGFSPRSVLFMSDQREATDARDLAENVADPVAVKVYSGAVAHGVALLDNPQAVQDILDWLSRTL